MKKTSKPKVTHKKVVKKKEKQPNTVVSPAKRITYVRQHVPKDKFIHFDVSKMIKNYKEVFGEDVMDFSYDISRCKKKDIIPTICEHTNDFLNGIPKHAREMLIFNMIKISYTYKTHGISKVNTFANDLVNHMFHPEEDNTIMDAIFNYVDNLDFEYSTKVEDNIEKNKMQYPEKTTIKRNGFVALHMLATMLRFIFPLYEEILSKRNDNNLTFEVQSSIVLKLNTLICERTGVNIINKMCALIESHINKSAKYDATIWHKNMIHGTNTLRVAIIETLFKRLGFNTCLKIDPRPNKGNAVSFLSVTMNITVSNSNRVKLPFTYNEVNGHTTGGGDDDDDALDRLMDNFYGSMGLKDETVMFMQDILVEDNIARFLANNNTKLTDLKPEYTHYFNALQADPENNSFVCPVQKKMITMLAYLPFAGTQNINNMINSDYMKLAVGVKHILKSSHLEFLASIISARQISKLSRMRDKSLTTRLQKEIMLDKDLLEEYTYMQNTVYNHALHLFDPEVHTYNPVFDTIKKIFNTHFVYNEFEDTSKNGEYIKMVSYTDMLHEVIQLFMIANNQKGGNPA